MLQIYDMSDKKLIYITNGVYKVEKSEGLGDSIDKITTITGVKKVVEIVSKALGKDCGCNERKEKLNKKYPYSK